MEGEKVDNFFVDGGLVFHKPTGSAILIERNSVAQRILSILKSRNEKK